MGGPGAGEDDRDVVGAPREEALQLAGDPRHLLLPGTAHDHPGAFGGPAAAEPEIGDSCAGLLGIRRIDDLMIDAEDPFPEADPLLTGHPLSAEFGLGEAHRHRRAAAREGHEPEEVRPTLRTARQDEEAVGHLRSAGIRGMPRRRPVEERPERIAVRIHPPRHRAKNLAELGQAKILRPEFAPDEVVKLGDGRIQVAREALPEAARGIGRLQGRDPRLNQAPEDEHLETPADAVGRAALSSGQARGQELDAKESDPLVHAALLERLRLAAGRGHNQGPLEASRAGFEPGAHDLPATRFRQSAKETGLRLERSSNWDGTQPSQNRGHFASTYFDARDFAREAALR